MSDGVPANARLGAFALVVSDALGALATVGTTMLLTRRLGVDLFGEVSLALAVVFAIEWLMPTLLARASTKLIAEAEDDAPIATTVLQTYLLLGVGAALLLVLCAWPLGRAMHSRHLTPMLLVLALEVPVFAAAKAHVGVLGGRRRLHECAIAGVGRVVTRTSVLTALVFAGAGSWSAILAGLLGFSAELVLARRFVRPALRGPVISTPWGLCVTALPLFFAVAPFRVYERLDLFMVRALDFESSDAGQYAAAQLVGMIPTVLAGTLVIVAITSLVQAAKVTPSTPPDVLPIARARIRDLYRAEFALIPIVGILSGCGSRWTDIVFGHDYRKAAIVAPILLLAGVAQLSTTTATAMLIARNENRLAIAITVPMLVVGAIAYAFVVPRFGMVGAAFANLAVSAGAAVTAERVVRHVWGDGAPASALLRALAAAAAAHGIGRLIATSAFTVVPIQVIVAAAAMLLLGERPWMRSVPTPA
ncbi:MAG: lipopolysaccharide biosynthesis protein [Polyangiales bacterium]